MSDELDAATVDKPAAKVPRVLPEQMRGLVLRLDRWNRVVIEAPDGTLIVISAAKTQGSAARIHVSAPGNWQIDREHVWRRKEYERCGLLAQFIDEYGDVNGNR